MINTKFHCDDTGTFTVTFAGHAGGAAKGENLVCAAVSGLATALVSALREMDGKGMLEKCVTALSSGSMEARFRARPAFLKSVMMVPYVIEKGIRELRRSYPEQIAVQKYFEI